MKQQALTRTKDAAYIAMFSALIAVGAFIRIPAGLVPITMQTAFVALAALAIGPNKAAVSVLVYILLGLCGLPVFASGGGIGYVLYPTFGYILGFALSAWVAGFIFNKFKEKTYIAAVLSGLAGVFAVYVIGLPYLYLIKDIYLGSPVTAKTLFVSCFAIFLPGDILTMAVAAYAAVRLRKAVKQG